MDEETVNESLEAFDMDLDTFDLDKISLSDFDTDLRDLSAFVKKIRSGHRANTAFPRREVFGSGEAAEDIEVTEAYQTVVNVIKNGEPIVLVHGRAGTGKSTLIRFLKQTMKLNLAVIAPTGIAALNAGGQTIHSFCCFPPRVITGRYIRQRKPDLCRNLDLLVLDEISMVRADLLDGVDRFLRLNGRNPNLPFGGVQILMVGDFFQLAPVVASREEEQYLREYYGGEYFFFAPAFQNAKCFTVELDHIFRQKDPEFIELLNHIREGTEPETTVARFNELCVRPPIPGPGTVTLTCTNRQAEQINREAMTLLPGEPRSFKAAISGEGFDNARRPPAPVELMLKEQAQVMFTRNDREGKRWVNGTVGTVTGFSGSSIQVQIRGGAHDGKIVEAKPAVWEHIRYRLDRKTGAIKPMVIGTFTQFPLIPAWAVTIHKAQGQTFDRAIVDLGSGAFSSGQLYVALSRCRTLGGLSLSRPICSEDVICDPVIVQMNQFLKAREARQ